MGQTMKILVHYARNAKLLLKRNKKLSTIQHLSKGTTWQDDPGSFLENCNKYPYECLFFCAEHLTDISSLHSTITPGGRFCYDPH